MLGVTQGLWVRPPWLKPEPPTHAGLWHPLQVERVITIMQNPRQYKIPDWFLNRQKDVKDGKYSQVRGGAAPRGVQPKAGLAREGLSKLGTFHWGGREGGRLSPGGEWIKDRERHPKGWVRLPVAFFPWRAPGKRVSRGGCGHLGGSPLC